MPDLACTSPTARLNDTIWVTSRLITNALMPLPYCSGPGMFSGKRPLDRALHVGQSLISSSTFTSSTVNLISRRTRCSRADGSMSERSIPQLSQTSTAEISSTVVVWKFSPVIDFCIDFCAALVSRFFLEDFLVSSLSVCDGGILEFLLVFFGRLFEQDGNHDFR